MVHPFASIEWPRALCAAVCLSVVATLGAGAWFQERSTARRIDVVLEEDGRGLRLAEVVEGGPAGRAGLAAGDRLLVVAGVPTSTLGHYDRAWSGFERGRPVTVEFERDGLRLRTRLVPGVPAGWWRVLLRALLVGGCLAVGTLSLHGRAGDVRARLLAGILFMLAFEFALPDRPPVGSAWEIAASMSFYVLTGFEAATELHLAASLPRPRRTGRAFVPALYTAGALIAGVGCATFAHDLLGGGFVPWSTEQVDGLIHQFVLPLWAIGVVVILQAAVVRWPERRGRLQAAVVLMGVLPWSVYILGSWALGYPGRVSPTWFDEILPALLVCYPAAVFVAIFRYRLLDLEALVRRSLVYGVLTGALVLLFYGALGAGGALVTGAFGERHPVWAFSIATIVLGIAFSPLRSATQRFIDRRLFPERGQLRRRLTELAAELPAQERPERMARHLAGEVRRLLLASSAALYVTEGEPQVLRPLAAFTGAHGEGEAGGHGDRRPPLASLPLPAALTTSLLRRRGPLPAAELATAGPEVAGALRVLDARLAVPLILDDALTGMLLVGRKATGRPFSHEEIELLGLLAQHVVIAFHNVRLQEAATHEDLTGLRRRESVLALLQTEIRRARRYGRPLSVALADLDHFKAINDSFGHLEGDRVLREVAQVMAAVLRTTDGIGRYGGEEFLCVLPETGAGAAAVLGDKLRAAVEAHPLGAGPGGPRRVTISVGVALLDGTSGTTAEAARRLLEAADRALYRAKAAGRNRVETASPADEPNHVPPGARRG